MLSEATAKRIKSLPEWDELEAHFMECVRALDAVSDIEDDYEVEARGRKRAVECMVAILSAFDIEDITDSDSRTETLAKLGMTESKN